jgi:DNA-directed RNA polymerase specialized sigma24 family protein
MSRIFPIGGERSNEELFFEHYPQLLKWALHLSDSDRGDAEDLVQDFYLQITHINVELAEVNEIEPYLFKILRNLHYSRLRRQGKRQQHELSIVDFDSLERGLAAVSRNDLLLVHSSLNHICEFACQRKSTSRAACIFILRFFLGYYSSEVMKIASITRMGVDRALQIVRGEARLYLENPTATRSVVRQNRGGIGSGKRLDDSKDLFLELRRTIFNTCEGPCFEHFVLKQHYAAESPGRFVVEELAHLVSCEVCLDKVNVILGLPLLDERSPDDTIGRDNQPGSGASKNSGFSITRGKKPDAATRRRRVLARRMREFLEHRPESLELAINGETRTTQRVTAAVNELKLTLSRSDEPGFIEVFSEQGVRLTYLHVVEPTSSPDLEQRQHLGLSDSRSLAVTLSFANDVSTVKVVYKDPVLAQAATLEDEPGVSLLPEKPCSDSAQNAVDRSPSEPHVPSSLTALPLTAGNRLRLPRFRMNPLLASALLLGFCSVVCFLLWTWSGAQISARTMLRRAEQSDASVAKGGQSGVIYQKVRLIAGGHTMERAIYRDTQKKRRFKQPKLNADEQRLKDKLDKAGVNWDEPLSATTYLDWRNHAQVARDVVQDSGQNLLTLTTTVLNTEIAQESLTVRASDFHPVARDIVFRDQGNEGTSVEIAELSYAVLDPDSVSPALYENAGLAGSPTSILPPVLPLLSGPELDMAELQVREKLHEFGADLGEDIHIKRAPQSIEVSGVVSTSQQARSLRASLNILPHVAVALRSPQDLRVANSLPARSEPELDSPEIMPPLLDEQLKQDFPNDAERTQEVDRLLAEADQCRWRSHALNVLVQRYHSLDNPLVRKIAEDHLGALAESATAIANWADRLPQYPDRQLEDSTQATLLDRGNKLTEASRGLEHDLADLLTAHAADRASPRSATLVVASCQQRLKTIQQLVASLR